MLSILIPTYNNYSVPLVKELHKQCVECHIDFEILVYDDGSNSSFNETNTTINSFQNCSFKALPNNIGRSAIRNLLAKNAKYNVLLFVDSGTFPEKNCFIKKYIDNVGDVVNGGMTCNNVAPKKPYILRWLFTKYREQNALCSSNFLIKKTIFETYPFDESIKTYGYEDVLFFETLKKNNINIQKINNPVIHVSDDNSISFIKKTEFAVSNLITLINSNKLDKENFKASNIHNKLEKLKLDGLVIYLFKILKPLLIKNFNSSYPSLFLFDFYRLGYYCTLKKIKN